MNDLVEDPVPEDWADIARQFLRNDPVAVSQVIRLITGHLTTLDAYNLGESRRDLIQDVLAALVKSLQHGRVREPRAFVSYVGVVVRNKFYDACRRTAVERVLVSPSSADINNEPCDLPVTDLLDLRGALAQLADDEWAVVDLHYNRGKTFDQIAVELKKPRGSVSGLLRKALRTLKAAVTDKGTSLGPPGPAARARAD